MTGAKMIYRKALVKKILNFSASYLLTEEERFLTHIFVSYINSDESYGYCVPYCDDEGNLDEVEIVVARGMSERDLIETIAHEMVHAKQYIRGELCPETTNFTWMGQEFQEHETHLISLEDYKNLPWEKEAFEVEKIIMEKFLESNPVV